MRAFRFVQDTCPLRRVRHPFHANRMTNAGAAAVDTRTTMNVVWGALVVLAAVAIGVTALLLVRRRAPEGGFFTDGDRAAGVFGVLATGFSVLLGFIVFLAFES